MKRKFDLIIIFLIFLLFTSFSLTSCLFPYYYNYIIAVNERWNINLKVDLDEVYSISNTSPTDGVYYTVYSASFDDFTFDFNHITEEKLSEINYLKKVFLPDFNDEYYLDETHNLVYYDLSQDMHHLFLIFDKDVNWFIIFEILY